MEETKEEKKDDWDRFVIEQNGSFLQSVGWGEFQSSIGREVYYLENDAFQALVIKYPMPLGRNYLFCPHGPVLAQNIKTCGFLDALQDLAKKEKSVFLRIEPLTNPSVIVRGKPSNCTIDDLVCLCFIKSKDIHPHKTLVLDLNLSEEELLAQMHEKTRYNIGLAARKGVFVKMADYNEKDFEEFWRLISLTYKRQRIKCFSKEYYKKQLVISGDNFKNALFIAYLQDKAIAANLVNLYGKTATYLHGGSDNAFRALMAPHLLQWEQIKYAKAQGCKIYDFYGCDEEKWPGVSRFKKGFGGREVEWCGTHDYVFDKWWYKIYKAARSILR